MGWLGDALGFVANPAIAIQTALGKKAIDAAVGQGNDTPAPVAPPTPQVDPRIKQTQDNLTKIANDYRTSIPTLQQKQGSILENQSRSSLASAIADNRSNFNDRGFLYSGMKQGADVASAQNEASNLAGEKQDLNTQLLGNANDLDQSAINSGLQIAGVQSNISGAAQGLSDDTLSLALKNMQAKSNSYSDIGSGLGSAIGSLVGSATGKSPATKISPTSPQTNSGFLPQLAPASSANANTLGR